MKIEDLDKDLVETWKQGGISTKVIGPLPGNDAVSLRHRLYRERKRMKQINHPDYHVASMASISLTSAPDGLVNLVIYPARLAINQALANAGIIPSNDPPDLD